MLQNDRTERHKKQLPTPRTVRRACNRELYRTVKRLKVRIADNLVKQAEEIYYKKVLLNLPYIAENGSNRPKLADWWDEHVATDIAELWQVDAVKLSQAFRSAFGG